MNRRFRNPAQVPFLLPCLIIPLIARIRGQLYACSPTTYAPNSTFQTNLNLLLSSLPSNANRPAGFYNTTVGQNNSTITVVYGLFLCIGDSTVPTCQKCVSDATKDILQRCPNNTGADIWSDQCWLHYSDKYFFSILQDAPIKYLSDAVDASDPSRFKQLLSYTINEVAVQAAYGSGSKTFATKEASYGEFQTLYTLAQCTPDISEDDCHRCLQGTIANLPTCCDGKQGGRVVAPSCYLRYEVYPFYHEVPSPPPLSPPTPTPVSTPEKVKGKGQSAKTIVMVVVSLVGAGILFCCAYYLLNSQIKKSRGAILRQKYFGSESTTLESLQFNLPTIEAATNKFSHENSLGKGGFGQVYKGTLSNGQEIAVKRLSKGSGQGAEEFKNEVLLIARLQHRNLVALLGFCIEEQEKILIYEYVHNRSLDHFLFGYQKSRVLNWVERCKIIGGVARGILYLHEYSRLKIIHRDLKPSNILLDDKMNPKISDFGLAKMVAINANEGSTNRIVGTYGYMSPEYAMFGQYSEKSDVFSFGVIVLEIISGKKNTSGHDQSQYADSLLSYAWKQWRDEKLLEMLDSNLKEFGLYHEVMKCTQIGLLCVQENPETRPSMATVVSYLSNDSIQLPIPQEPAFFLDDRMELATRSKELCSNNEVSLSEFFPR